MFAPAGRITARAGLRSKLAAIVLAVKRAPTEKNAVCLTVVGADSISARPGRRGRRPLHFSETVFPCRGIGGEQPPDQHLLNS